jgi:hypothetical protein
MKENKKEKSGEYERLYTSELLSKHLVTLDDIDSDSSLSARLNVYDSAKESYHTPVSIGIAREYNYFERATVYIRPNRQDVIALIRCLEEALEQTEREMYEHKGEESAEPELKGLEKQCTSGAKKIEKV